MKKLIKAFTAYILVFTLSVGILPTVVFANMQTPVESVRIIDKTPKGSPEYKLTLEWDKPNPSVRPDTVGDESAQTANHDVSGYRIEYRNLSDSEQNWRRWPANVTNTGVSPSIDLSLTLPPATVWEFKVTPYHSHPITKTDSNGNVISVEYVEATLDNYYTEQHALFFTNMTVYKPEGSGSEITVVWDAPTVNNLPVFNRYIFYWSADAREPMMPGASGVYSRQVRTDEAVQIGRTGDGAIKYQYTFADSSLKTGYDYSLKIEPAVGSGNTYNRWRWQVDKRLSIGAPAGVSYSFAHTDHDDHEYRSDTFRLRIPLIVREESPTQICIQWNPSDIGQYPIRIYESAAEGVPGNQIGLVGSGGTQIYYWIVDKPDSLMWYYITMGDSSEPDESVWVYYDPNELDYVPYEPNILEISNNNSWLVTWEAFIRDIYNEEEAHDKVKDENGQDKFIDTDIEYEIWVTDDITNFDSYVESLGTYSPAAGEATQHAGTQKWAYTRPIGQYYNMDTYSLEPLVANKVYYVKIQAVRGRRPSKASYSAFFYGPTGAVITNPQMMAKPPLRIDSVDLDAINISWVSRWYEVYNDHGNPYGNVNYPEGWYSLVGVTESGELTYGVGEHDLSTDEFKTDVDINETLEVDNTLPRRRIDITGAGYEIHVAEYDEVIGSEGDPADAEKYLQDIIADSGGPWDLIVEPGDNVTTLFTHSITEASPAGVIQPNTPYVIFFRPVAGTADDRIAACYPVYVSTVTSNDPGPIDIDPTTPTLKVATEKTTQSTITVYWERAEGLEYELAYGDLLTQYPDGGKRIPPAELLANSVKYTPPHGGTGDDYAYTITGLFAASEYYVWVRAQSGNKQSSWSNPVSETTKDIDPPLPPRGLGIVSEDVIEKYNEENSSELQPVSSDYMILEWMRDYNDYGTETSATATGDVVRLDTQAQLGLSYMAKFGSLVANRTYYMRAKTILTMLRSGDSIKTQYSYRVQLSETYDFEDVIEIYTPALDPAPPLARDMIRKESEWTDILRMKTFTSPGEYDGEADDRLYPLPASDFEISYDPETGELKYRFRSMGKAADGTNDNSVDQRFISRMIQDRVYIYTLDLTRYGDYKIGKRTLELPYSIVRAMETQQVGLRFVADNLTLTIAHGGLNTAEIAAIPDFGVQGTSVIYSLEQSAPALSNGEEFASMGQTFSVKVQTPSTVAQLSYFNRDIKVSLKLNSRYSTYDRHVNTYVSNRNVPGWTEVNNSYDNAAGTMTFTTKTVGSYSAIARELPEGGPVSDGAYTLLTRLNITDLQDYDPNQNINASQFNNIVAAIARGKKSVAIYENMSDADYQSLGRARILVSGSEVTREAGISALIRLYELKTNGAVRNYGSLATTPYRDIAEAQATYQIPLLKAAKLGFFDSPTVTNPKANLTFGDAFDMFAIIIDDGGL